MNNLHRNSQRIRQVFANKPKALITYIMGGDPANQGTVNMMLNLAQNGADIIELGMAFSDPMADGIIIQQAGLRALKNGATLAKTLRAVKDFRKKDHTTPIVLMGYYNPIMQYGEENFAKTAQKNGADAVIVVDLPLEECDDFKKITDKYGIDLIQLIAPTSFDRLAKIAKAASGFVYYISILGITGTKSATKSTLASAKSKISNTTPLPLVAGFGIKTTKDVKMFTKAGFDGIVVGSSLIEKIFLSHIKKKKVPTATLR